MAIVATACGTANSTTAGATLAISATVVCAVGTTVVVCIAADNSGASGATSTTSVTDVRGNTYTLRADRLQDPGNADAGTSLRVYESLVQYALAVNDAITVNFSPNTTSKAAAVWRVEPTAGSRISFIIEEGNVGTGANPSVTTASSVTSGNLVIGVTAAETSTVPTADSDTSSGTWSTAQAPVANSGSGVTSQVCTTQTKVVTGTATQTYNTTLISLDRAISILTFTEVALPVRDPQPFPVQALRRASVW